MPETAEERAAREAGESRSRGPSDEGRGVARKLLARFRGRAEDAIAQMADENADLRGQRRELRDKLTKFEAPGVVVLTADEAKVYTDLKALGATPKDLKAALDEVPTLRAKVLEHDRRTVAEEAAPLLGWNPAALREVVKDKGLEISFKDGTVDGKPVKVPHVKLASDDKAAPVPLSEFAKTNLTAYLPALAAKGTATPAAAGNIGSRTTTQMVEQGASSSTAQNGEGVKQRPPGGGNYLTPGMRAAKHTTT